MRKDGTKYDKIDQLPANALPVSVYARNNKKAVGSIYMKYRRYLDKGNAKPDYTIRCWQGANFVIPE